MGSGFSKMKKQAKMLQQQFAQIQDELKNLVIEGSAGGGLVKIQMNGEKEVLKVTIQPDCVDKEDIEGLEDLIRAAFHDALKKIEQETPQNQLPFGL